MKSRRNRLKRHRRIARAWLSNDRPLNQWLLEQYPSQALAECPHLARLSGVAKQFRVIAQIHDEQIVVRI